MEPVKKKTAKKSLTIELDFLGGNKTARLTNELMHAADMFEKGKQFVTHSRFIVTGNPDLKALCNNVANGSRKAGGYAVFVGIRKINGKRVNKPYAWFMKDVQSISMKQGSEQLGWALFKDILEQLDYVATTDENMRVIDVA